MSNFLNQMKKKVEENQIEDHILVIKEYDTSIRTAYFSCLCAASCFLDDDLDTQEKAYLNKMGSSLKISEAEQQELFQNLQVDDSEKMPLLEELLASLTDELMKQFLLIEIKAMYLHHNKFNNENEQEFCLLLITMLFPQNKDLKNYLKQLPLSIDAYRQIEAEEKKQATEERRQTKLKEEQDLAKQKKRVGLEKKVLKILEQINHVDKSINLNTSLCNLVDSLFRSPFLGYVLGQTSINSSIRYKLKDNGYDIPENKFNKFTNIKDIVDYIEKNY